MEMVLELRNVSAIRKQLVKPIENPYTRDVSVSALYSSCQSAFQHFCQTRKIVIHYRAITLDPFSQNRLKDFEHLVADTVALPLAYAHGHDLI